MSEVLQLLENRFHKLARLEHALTFLQWDHMVMMPAGGSEPRSQAMAELTSLHHELLTAEETKDLLGQAETKNLLPLQVKNLSEMRREYEQAACLPADLVRAKSLAGSQCEHDWRQQRKNNDWTGFARNFREVVNLARKEAQARRDFAPHRYATPYDAMLDLYCTGDSSTFIAEVFSRLKTELPDLIQQIVEKQRDETIPDLNGHYPLDLQIEANRRLMLALGFDFNCGRMDVSAHPFSTGCRGDQRITTRFRGTDFLDALLATAHETGHASYESGLPPDLDGLPAGRARNLCIHESQSLLFEKQIFLARPFFNFFSTELHSHLPASSPFSAQQLWQVATRVKPSYIRVEADEATYPLHVILRYEIESLLINNDMEIDDIPDAWNEKMESYLGISTTDNYTDGCMQDMHWTDGSFGYFPCYTMGALNSVQLFNGIRRNFPDWQERMARGDIAFIRKWLAEKVWSKGSTMDSQEILTLATGENTNPDHFLHHLRLRYLEGQY